MFDESCSCVFIGGGNVERRKKLRALEFTRQLPIIYEFLKYSLMCKLHRCLTLLWNNLGIKLYLCCIRVTVTGSSMDAKIPRIWCLYWVTNASVYRVPSSRIPTIVVDKWRGKSFYRVWSATSQKSERKHTSCKNCAGNLNLNTKSLITTRPVSCNKELISLATLSINSLEGYVEDT